MDMKTAISIPDPVFEAAEELAHRLGMSRSRLYAEAIDRYVAEHRTQDVTERLDEVYRSEPAQVDSLLQALQLASLDNEDCLADEDW